MRQLSSRARVPAVALFLFSAALPAQERAIAFWPPSVTQAGPSGPTTTPCGAAPWPSATTLRPPSRGSSRFKVPSRWPQNHTVPSALQATSREPEPGRTL